MTNKKKENVVSLIGAGGMAFDILSILENNGIKLEYMYDNTIAHDLNLHKYIISPVFRKNNKYLIAVGYPQIKEKIIKNLPIKWADSLVDKSAHVGKYVELGKGSVVYPYACINPGAQIGMLAGIQNNTSIGHTCKIGDMFQLSGGAVISGDVIIGNKVFIGCNACVKEKIKICDDVTIGAGTVVIRDITEPGTYVGNPARKL